MADEATERNPIRRPTIADVARRAHTSRGTVSFVINDRPGVAPATRERVRVAMKDLQWTPNQLARSLSTSRAFAIGLILARDPQALSADPFFAPFIAGIETRLEQSGQFLVLRFAPNQESEVAAYRDLAAQKRVDGFILSDLLVNDHRLELLQGLGVPAITLNPAADEALTTAVSRSDETGLVASIDHLVGLGHQRIAYLGGPSRYLHAVHRRAVWEATMRTHRLVPHAFVETDFTAAGGSLGTAEVLDITARERPTAIVYANDLMAAAGMALAQGRGLRVPDDLSIIGYDDAELSAYLSPSLTTVATDPLAWGAAAAGQLLEMIAGNPVGNRELPAPALIVRGSTGPVPR